MNEGWVKLHRQLVENPRFKDGDWLKVWLWMLMTATHKPYSVLFKGERISLQPGQFTAGRNQISEQTGVNPSKVKRVIEVLKSEHQIEQQISNACSLFTITKWVEYQQIDQRNDQPVTSHRPASDQPVTTKQECKNVRSSSTASLSDAEWLAGLQAQEVYQTLNVRAEFQKMENWCALRNAKPTRRRFINWLNRAEKPMQSKGPKSGNYSESELTLIAMGKA